MAIPEDLESSIIAAINGGDFTAARTHLNEIRAASSRRGDAGRIIIAMAHGEASDLLADFLRGHPNRIVDASDVFACAIGAGAARIARVIEQTMAVIRPEQVLWTANAFRELGGTPLESLPLLAKMAAGHFQRAQHASHVLDGLCRIPATQVAKHLRTLIAAEIILPVTAMLRVVGSQHPEAANDVKDVVVEYLQKVGPASMWHECHDHTSGSEQSHLVASLFRSMVNDGHWQPADVARCLTSIGDIQRAASMGVDTVTLLPFLKDPSLATTAMDLIVEES